MDRFSYLNFTGGNSKVGETGSLAPRKPLSKNYIPEEQPYDYTLRQKYGDDIDNRELDKRGIRYFPNAGPESYDNRKERNLRLKSQEAKHVKARSQTQGVKDAGTLKSNFMGSETKPKLAPKDVADLKDVELIEAPVGTFPMFNEHGYYPGLDAKTQKINLLQSELSKEGYLPPYEVITNEEILLKGFPGEVYRKFSCKLPPTHRFPTSSTFIVQQRDPKLGKSLVYPLPPGYYRPRRKMNESKFQRVKTDLRNSCEKIFMIPFEYKGRVSKRQMYFVQEGFFYHEQMIYCLPAGWIIPNRNVQPVFLTAMACYRPWVVLNGSKNMFSCFTQNSFLKAMLTKPPRIQSEATAVRMQKDILSRSDLIAIFKFHSPNFNTDFYKLISFYHVIFTPSANKLFNQAVPKEKLRSTDTIELFFYMLYTYHLGYYPGPAPPFELLKNRLPEHNFTKQFTKRLIGKQKGKRKDKDKFDKHNEKFQKLQGERENPRDWGEFTPFQPSRLLIEQNNKTQQSSETEQGLSEEPSANFDDANWDSSDWETDSASNSSRNSSRGSSRGSSRTGSLSREQSSDRSSSGFEELSSGQYSEAGHDLSLNSSESEMSGSYTTQVSNPDQVDKGTRPSKSRRVQWKQNVGSSKYQKPVRRVWKAPKGPAYYTRIAIRDQNGENIAESMRPPKDDFDPRREIRVRDQDDPELDPDYFDHRVWVRRGQVPGQTWSTRIPKKKN